MGSNETVVININKKKKKKDGVGWAEMESYIYICDVS